MIFVEIRDNMKNSKEYLDKVSKIIEKPYFKELEYYGVIDNEEIEYVLKGVYGYDIRISLIGYTGVKNIYNSRDKRIYQEYSSGQWVRREYDEVGNNIYYEGSNGYWKKFEYDEFGNNIYYEGSNKIIYKNEKK
jgi:hypothetical protein